VRPNKLKKTSSQNPSPMIQLNGLAKVVAMFQTLSPLQRSQWLSQLEEKAPWLKSLVAHVDFTYRDIIRLDRMSLHKAFTEIEVGLWLKAFFWTPLSLQKHILLSLPQGRRANFIDQFTNSPKPSRREVILAQFSIAKKIHEKITTGNYRLYSRPQVSPGLTS
jgi:flagellar motor switch protein FliG